MAAFNEAVPEMRKELEVEASLVEDGTGGDGVWPSLGAPKGLVFSRNIQKHCCDLGVHIQGWGLGGGVSKVSLARLGIPSRGKTPFQDPAALPVLGAESWQCRVVGFTQAGGVAWPQSLSLTRCLVTLGEPGLAGEKGEQGLSLCPAAPGGPSWWCFGEEPFLKCLPPAAPWI